MDQIALAVSHSSGISVYKNLNTINSLQNPSGTYRVPLLSNNNNQTDLAGHKFVATDSHIFASAPDAPIIYQYSYSKGNYIQKSFYSSPSSKVDQLGLITAMISGKSVHLNCSSGNFDHLLICGTANGFLLVWDITTGVLLRKVKGHFGAVTDLSLGGENFDLLISCGGTGDSMIHVWDLNDVYHNIQSNAMSSMLLDNQIEKFKPVCTLTDHSQSVNQLHVNAFGDRFLTCSSDKTIKYWTFTQKITQQASKLIAQCLLTVIYDTEITSCFLDASESVIIAGHSNGTISVLNLESNSQQSDSVFDSGVIHFLQQEFINKYQLNSHKSSITSIQLIMNDLQNTQGQLITSDSDGFNKIWDLKSRQLLHTINYFHASKLGPVFDMKPIYKLDNLFVKMSQKGSENCIQQGLKNQVEQIVHFQSNVAANVQDLHHQSTKMGMKST